jgi:rubrerythrin
MENRNCETILNLARSFAGESQARTRYTIYADQARKEGYEWIARIFEETAANEAVHAEEFLEMLQSIGGCAENINLTAGYPYTLGNTSENLAAAQAGELHEHDDAYPGFAEMARREGFDDAARLWLQIARIEGVHHNVFRQMKEQLDNGTLTKKESAVSWRCLNCGYTYEGPNACDPCPVCGKSAHWQEGELNKKQLLPKK